MNPSEPTPAPRSHSSALGRWIAATACGLLVAVGNGCGTPGSPSPPSLTLPIPVIDLAAIRRADSVHLEWTMPRRTTDKLLIKQVLTVHICRRLESSPCVGVGDPQFSGNQAEHFDDALPPELASGAYRLLTYTLEVRNRSGHAAGPSNAAFSAAGSAPAALTGFSAEVRADGVVLQWHPATLSGQSPAIEIHRTLNAGSPQPGAKPQKGNISAGSPPPAEETLRVALSGELDPGKALDPVAAFDRTYIYRAERGSTISVGGHDIRILGSPSEALTVVTRDVFPPRTPQDLAVVPDSAAKAIDLSWTPDSEPDLAGYVVYRRDTATNAASPERISSATPVAGPAFRDAKAEPGHTYAYSVSAVDQHGNESARSAEEQETLPAPQ